MPLKPTCPQQGTFPPLVQNGSYNVWGTTFSGATGLTGLYYDPWPLDWTASLLGQLEQIPLFNQLNFAFSSGWLGPFSTGWDPQNTTVLSTQVGVLLCPSEDKKQTTIGPGTRKNYVANFGGPANFMSWSGVLVPLKDNPPLAYSGVYWNSQQRQHVRDGGDHRRHLEHGDVQRDVAGLGAQCSGLPGGDESGKVRTCGLSRSPISGTRAPRAGSRHCSSCKRASLFRASLYRWEYSHRLTAISGSPATLVPA